MKYFLLLLCYVTAVAVTAAATENISGTKAININNDAEPITLVQIDGDYTGKTFARNKRANGGRRKKKRQWDQPKFDPPAPTSPPTSPPTSLVKDMIPHQGFVGTDQVLCFVAEVDDLKNIEGVWFEIYHNGVSLGRFDVINNGELFFVTLSGFQSGSYKWKVWSKLAGQATRETESSTNAFQILLPKGQEITAPQPTNPAPTQPPTPAPTTPFVPPFPTERPTEKPTNPAPTQPPTPAPTTPFVPPFPTERPTEKPTTSAPIEPSTNAPAPIRAGLQPDCLNIDPNAFNICLDLKSLSGQYESWMDSFAAARDRWQEVIVEDDGTPAIDLSPHMQSDDVATGLPPALDDLYIAGFEDSIDGAGGVLGMAGPGLLKRRDGKLRPLTGIMRFDQADIQNMQRAGTWTGVIAHEMGHVLGLGNLFSMNNLHSGLINDDEYTGYYAKEEWKNMGCSGDLPIETDGGLGTAGGHWDEMCLEGELMTGYVDNEMHLSRLTIGALKDLGYGVNMEAADPFTLENLSQCGTYCPEARRQLRKKSKRKRRKSKISEAGHQKIVAAAKKVLEEHRQHAPTDLPDDVVYVGGDKITVFLYEDGEIKDEEITWESLQG